MKSFVIAMSIFAVLIVGGMAFDYSLNATTEELLSSCEEIDKNIREDKLKAAYEKEKQLSEYIDGKKPLLSSILDHSNIDEIEEQISELLGFTEQNDAENAVVSIRKLEHMFNHLPENYALTLQNVL
ncbi:MAG: DUF4363 family protein [Clostridia bacterium]|nr:DUF4363 family protein [Clostridia bacterium]